MSQRIAFFDFDGTITTKDTLVEVIRYQHGTFKCYLGFLLNSPFVLAYKLGIITNQKAKEQVLKFFFRKMPLEKFQEGCDGFAREAIPALLRKKAVKEIQLLKDSGAEVVIVTASAENWLQEWCRSMQLSLIGTKLEIKDGRMTGNISGRNCHGNEKVQRITAAYDIAGYKEIYCYGDTKSDKPMLSLATFPFYKPFR